jgi:hypothetical protein
VRLLRLTCVILIHGNTTSNQEGGVGERTGTKPLVRYLDTFVEDLRQDGRAATGRWDSVSGVLLYPRRPADPARLQLVEEVATREALMVVWYDETPWKAERLTRDVR